MTDKIIDLALINQNIPNKEIDEFLHIDTFGDIAKQIIEINGKKNEIKNKEFYDCRVHQAILINGRRGTGKTQFLVNLKDVDNINKYATNETGGKIKAEEILILRPFDPTRFSGKPQLLLPALIAHLLEGFEKDEKNLEKIQKSIMKLGNALESENLSNNATGIDKIMKLKNSQFIEQYIHKLFVDIGKLVILPIDDLDVADELCQPLTEIIRIYLPSPYLLPIVSVDFDQLHSKIFNDLDKVLERREYFGDDYMYGRPRLVDHVDALLAKVYPNNLRHKLPKFDDKDFKEKYCIKFLHFKKDILEENMKFAEIKFKENMQYKLDDIEYLIGSLIIGKFYVPKSGRRITSILANNLREFVQLCRKIDNMAKDYQPNQEFKSNLINLMKIVIDEYIEKNLTYRKINQKTIHRMNILNSASNFVKSNKNDKFFESARIKEKQEMYFVDEDNESESNFSVIRLIRRSMDYNLKVRDKEIPKINVNRKEYISNKDNLNIQGEMLIEIYNKIEVFLSDWFYGYNKDKINNNQHDDLLSMFELDSFIVFAIRINKYLSDSDMFQHLIDTQEIKKFKGELKDKILTYDYLNSLEFVGIIYTNQMPKDIAMKVEFEKFITAFYVSILMHENYLNILREFNDFNFKETIKLCYQELNETKLNETKLNETKLNETKLNETKLNETKLNETKLNENKVCKHFNQFFADKINFFDFNKNQENSQSE